MKPLLTFDPHFLPLFRLKLGPQACQGKFRLDIRKIFITERAVNPGQVAIENGLVTIPGVLTLKDMVWWQPTNVIFTVELHVLKDLFLPK